MRDPLMRPRTADPASDPAMSLWVAARAETPALHARASDPPTSRAAAASLAGTDTILADLLSAYRAAGSSGLTDEEAALAAGLDPRSGAWKRCSDLRAAGAIIQTGETRKGSSGRARIVCRLPK